MSNHVTIVAEAGVNHDGDLARALEMVDAAAEAGADAVKFQTFVPAALASAHAPTAAYQRAATGGEQSQRDLLTRLALPFDAHFALLERCRERRIEFLSSPFDHASARFLLDELQLPRIKLGSGELTNGPLLLEVARGGVELILSTGMATLVEIEAALAIVAYGIGGDPGAPTPASLAAAAADTRAQESIRQQVTLLHCTTAYPCPLDEINLRAMDTLREHFGLRTGYSDHSLGVTVAIAAAARGACLVEKHFTLDPSLPGPDQAASLDPLALRELVAGVRVVEASLGHAVKAPTASEQDNVLAARKGLCAARDIAAGEPFSPDNLTVKRPATGLPPNDYWSLLGHPASRDFAADEPIR